MLRRLVFLHFRLLDYSSQSISSSSNSIINSSTRQDTLKTIFLIKLPFFQGGHHQEVFKGIEERKSKILKIREQSLE